MDIVTVREIASLDGHFYEVEACGVCVCCLDYNWTQGVQALEKQLGKSLAVQFGD